MPEGAKFLYLHQHARTSVDWKAVLEGRRAQAGSEPLASFFRRCYKALGRKSRAQKTRI